MVKYIANRPAKNISSLDNHTIVPTDTTFGRVREWTLLESKPGVADAVEVTLALWTAGLTQRRRGWVVLRMTNVRRCPRVPGPDTIAL
jgi:hypothetical protein